jgi:hypothetical protein
MHRLAASFWRQAMHRFVMIWLATLMRAAVFLAAATLVSGVALAAAATELPRGFEKFKPLKPGPYRATLFSPAVRLTILDAKWNGAQWLRGGVHAIVLPRSLKVDVGGHAHLQRSGVHAVRVEDASAAENRTRNRAERRN